MTISLAVESWHVWMIIGMVLIIAETIGAEFVLLALGAAALLTARVTAVYGLGLNAQLLAASASAVFFVPLFVYFYRRKFKATGTRAVISEGLYKDSEMTIEAYGGRMGLRIQGDFFPARSTEGDPLQAGELVRVLEIQGLTAIVERI